MDIKKEIELNAGETVDLELQNRIAAEMDKLEQVLYPDRKQMNTVRIHYEIYVVNRAFKNCRETWLRFLLFYKSLPDGLKVFAIDKIEYEEDGLIYCEYVQRKNGYKKEYCYKLYFSPTIPKE